MISRALTDQQIAILDGMNARIPGRKAEKRFRLFWAQEGRCFWCGEPMEFKFSRGGYVGENAATLEHLDCRLSPERGMRGGERRIVAAHMKCNHAYNLEDEIAIGIEELRRRASYKHVRDREQNKPETRISEQPSEQPIIGAMTGRLSN